MAPGAFCTKVFIADDHPVVRQGVRAVLEADADITVVAEAADGQAAAELARTLDWDVAVIDYLMPGLSGVDLVKQIKQDHPDRPVLVLSMYPEGPNAAQVMRAGASGYLNKESAGEQLAMAVRKVAHGGRYVSPALAERMAEEITARSERPLHETLSDREYRVMCLVAAGTQVNEIARELSLSPTTVSTYRTRVLQKLGLANNAELVCYAVRHRIEPR